MYHKVTLQGKLNLYDFYLATMQKSDNQGRSKPVYRYHKISRCVHQWRHLKIIKRGVALIRLIPFWQQRLVPSQSSVLPAPILGEISQTIGTVSVVLTIRWIYAQFIAVDANFKLKSKNRQIKDPELGSGWTYFVEDTAYTCHVADNPHQNNVTSCGTEFHAVNQANSRGGGDYIASGVVKAVCARHCFVLPNAVGDLQRGERYINTDYIIATYLERCQVHDIKISYDIACKWSINLHSRFATYHEDVDLSALSLTYLVPKFHLPAHGAKCQVQYSFNYTRGVGRTHGETVEQEWAYINLAALSTREMGPGARHAALDDSWGGWNWRKILGLGSLLEKNLLKATEMASKQRQAADDFTATFPRETVRVWRRMVKDWETDAAYPNPYLSNDRASKVSAARLRLTQEETEEAERGNEALHTVSASVFIRAGLELEDQQYALQVASAAKTSTDTQKATLFERRGSLLHQIKKWREVQAIYMPGVFNSCS
ncbi:hypothetical protein BJ322DRAFT_1113656 [Thelephora terrestris]|uniref:Uncharacterized protein n=1 Tax=Thelephora terrestris TaxID=56493 RepID=A0A9P6L2G5_9AGAM|nr:hypothetical protein BJ322DRAFT_1113656 [Thelephora terrestris]